MSRQVLWWLVATGTVLVCLGAVGSVASLSAGHGRAAEPLDRPSLAFGSPTTGAPTAAGGAAAPVRSHRAPRPGVPVSIRVPALGIVSRLDRLGVDASGALERPPHWMRAGWYAGGPRPGQVGPAVIAGHVDSPFGPAVFTGLDALRPGDLIEVRDASGTVVRFRVDHLSQAPKNAFPTEAVYGPTPDPELRLITCSGDYDSSAGGYQDNLIVYAMKAAA